ncbi:DUF3606 domain-containing protein [Ensifer canadensis]
MADDRTKMLADRRLASGTKKYSVDYFAKKHGIPAADARRLIKQHVVTATRPIRQPTA